MQVGDGEDEPRLRTGGLLKLKPWAQRAKVVAEMGDSGGLYAREDDSRARGETTSLCL